MNITSEYVFSRLQPRPAQCHKGTFGRVVLVTGSARFPGAAVLCAGGALQAGAGYGIQVSDKEVCRTVVARYPEVVVYILPKKKKHALKALSAQVKGADAVVVGNGLGTDGFALEKLKAVLAACECPIVIDADGINLFAAHKLKGNGKSPLIFTPHKGELARLTGAAPSQLREDFFTPARAFAKKNHAIVVCKDAVTVTIDDKGNAFTNTSGNAGLAKAGTGDVLAGIIGALAAQGYAPLDSALCGVWLHGAAGDAAAQRYSQYGMLAHQVADSLGAVFLHYMGK